MLHEVFAESALARRLGTLSSVALVVHRRACFALQPCLSTLARLPAVLALLLAGLPELCQPSQMSGREGWHSWA